MRRGFDGVRSLTKVFGRNAQVFAGPPTGPTVLSVGFGFGICGCWFRNTLKLEPTAGLINWEGSQ